MPQDRMGEYVYALYKDGVFFAERSLNCGKSMAASAVKQWERKGYKVVCKRQPKSK